MLSIEVKTLIEDAKQLPADGQVYCSGNIRMTHKPRTSMKFEQVLVSLDDKTWRSLKTGKGWTRPDEVCGQV